MRCFCRLPPCMRDPLSPGGTGPGRVCNCARLPWHHAAPSPQRHSRPFRPQCHQSRHWPTQFSQTLVPKASPSVPPTTSKPLYLCRVVLVMTACSHLFSLRTCCSWRAGATSRAFLCYLSCRARGFGHGGKPGECLVPESLSTSPSYTPRSFYPGGTQIYRCHYLKSLISATERIYATLQ